jgi:hypothetical protein
MIHPNNRVDQDHSNQSSAENQQEKTDPNLTELKGFTDSDEKLEPKEDQIDAEKPE